MARDRFVWFKNKPVPEREEIGKIVADYLGDFMASSEWAAGRWTALLVGNKSWPFRRVSDIYDTYTKVSVGAYEEQATEERFIEVFVGSENIDVITRRQDVVTNAIADGLARALAEFYRVEMECVGGR